MNLNNKLNINYLPKDFTNNWTKESVKVIDDNTYNVFKDKNNSMITLILNEQINETDTNWRQK